MKKVKVSYIGNGEKTQKIKLPKPDYLRDLPQIELPTITCKECGKEILDTPSNWKYAK